ncbi:MAG: LOG family protein [bacterium]|nr:LOG family protein [bacterium]MDE0287904.1 LOG family protein [bacterium]MDE0439717.1 LOG family protein [bacterium]
MDDRIVAVYGASSSVPGDGVYEVGVELGRRLAQAGFGVVNGGYSGLMEAVSAGAAGAGGRAIGVTAPSLFPGRPGGNSHLTEEIPAESLIDRIKIMSELSFAYIVLPGSIGTLTELALAWNDAFLAARRGLPPDPVIAFRQAWGRIVEMLTADLRTAPGLITMVDTAREAVDAVIEVGRAGPR